MNDVNGISLDLSNKARWFSLSSRIEDTQTAAADNPLPQLRYAAVACDRPLKQKAQRLVAEEPFSNMIKTADDGGMVDYHALDRIACIGRKVHIRGTIRISFQLACGCRRQMPTRRDFGSASFHVHID